MAKNTMGTKLPRKLEQKMSVVGEQIKLARLRRNLSVAQVAERATCSSLTVSRIEKGAPTVAIGIYLRVQTPEYIFLWLRILLSRIIIQVIAQKQISVFLQPFIAEGKTIAVRATKRFIT